MTEPRRIPSVFVSWAHGDDAWKDTVARFTVALRRRGIEADVDLFHAHEAGVNWETFGPQAIRNVDTVLIAVSEAYKRRWEEDRSTRSGAGVDREANVLKDLFDRDQRGFYERVVIVVLPGSEDTHVPAELPGLPRFGVPSFDDPGLESLLRRLRNEPEFVAEPVARPLPLLPRRFDDDAPPDRVPREEDFAADVGERLMDLSGSGGSGPRDPRLQNEWTQLTAAMFQYASEADLGQTPEVHYAEAARGRRFSRGPRRLVIGCMMGRRTVHCGVLDVAATDAFPTGDDVRVLRTGEGTRLPIERRGSEALYDEAVALILRAARQLDAQSPGTPVSAIGIGTPGVVDVSTGELLLSVTLPQGSQIPYEIAERLMERGPDVVERVFGVPVGETRRLADRILVDNDVRCVARQYLCQNQWRNFACVYVGSGVGSGMVVDRRVYYGANGSSGHIGHIELERATATWSVDGRRGLPPVRCDCGIEGFHFDAMANFAGLERLARVLADERLADVLAELEAVYRARGVDGPDFYRDVFPALLAQAHRRDTAAFATDALAALARVPEFDGYLASVLDAYAGILATGIATLAEVFDPGSVVLCGPMIDGLRTSETFHGTVRRLLPGHVFHHLSAPKLTLDGHVRDALWRGAALLPFERWFLGADEASRVADRGA